MDPTYQMIWTHAAESDLREIIEYISLDKPQAALKILTEILDKASDLYDLPDRGCIVPELQSQGIFQYREFVLPPWPKKVRDGREADIIHCDPDCVDGGACMQMVMKGRPAFCVAWPVEKMKEWKAKFV